ncbi:MAG: hypothetical protein JSR27_07915 [Proteobacteria bacterium]|nr:hypothetical protein [Pseudomonadota bacterium]
MKRNTSILVCLGLLAASSLASAAQLEPVHVRGTAVDCTPPNSRAVCSAWHAQIRRNFTLREIGMLFGARTSYPNYTASFDRVQARYDNLRASFAANLGNNPAVASK